MDYDGVIAHFGGVEDYQFCCGGHGIDVSTTFDMTKGTSLDMTRTYMSEIILN